MYTSLGDGNRKTEYSQHRKVNEERKLEKQYILKKVERSVMQGGQGREEREKGR